LNGQKYDTRIVGLEVVPNAKEILVALYEKGTKMCESYGLETYYNQFMKEQFKFRWDIVLKHEEIYKIEDEIAVGQIEELIDQAKDDVEMIYYYNEVLIPAHLPGAPESPIDSTEEEDDADVWEGSGTMLTLENYEQVLAEEMAKPHDPKQCEDLEESIAYYEELMQMKQDRETKMLSQANEYAAHVDTHGGGWKVGSQRPHLDHE